MSQSTSNDAEQRRYCLYYDSYEAVGCRRARRSRGTRALSYNVWTRGELNRPLARIKVDEKNCFGSLEWPAVRQATKQGLPRHHAATCWKHRVSSSVEQDGVQPLPKGRGAEQGDVDGPSECSLTLGIVGSEARSTLHRSQRSGNLPWSSHPGEQIADMEAYRSLRLMA